MSVKKTRVVNNTSPIRTSVRGLVLWALGILGGIAIVSNVISSMSLSRINSSSTAIADDSMKSIENLSDISEKAENIYHKALSHIVATDFSTKVKMTESIQEDEAFLEKTLNQNIATETDEQKRKGDEQLASEYLELKRAVNKLTAASARLFIISSCKIHLRSSASYRQVKSLRIYWG